MHWTDEQLGAYVDGEASGEDAAAIRAHLAGCPACSATVTLLGRVNEAVRETAVEPSAAFEAETLARLRALPMPRRSLASRLGLDRLRLAPALAAASLAVVAVVGYRVARPAPDLGTAAIVDEVELAEQAEFLEDMDLLEDLDVVESMEVPG